MTSDISQHIIDIYQQGHQRGGVYMSDREKEIIETFKKVIPNLSTIEQEKLLSFGEGMAFKFNRQDQQKEELANV